MPHSVMNLLELARFLGIDQRRAERMAQRGEIPCRKIGGQLRFNQAELTEWLQQHMPELDRSKLADMDAGIGAHRQTETTDTLVVPLLRPEAVTAELGARTKNSVLKELVALAQETGLLYDGEILLEAVFHREELCSTAMPGGIAIPHPRRPLPYAVAEPILVVARTASGIGFGAPDGRLTDLFFLTCSQDDRHHLHILARLCRLLQNNEFVIGLREAETVEEMISLIHRRESEVITES
jgi:nitrogen PTS system EIIA component